MITASGSSALPVRKKKQLAQPAEAVSVALTA
jgi:hypothetical protein